MTATAFALGFLAASAVFAAADLGCRWRNRRTLTAVMDATREPPPAPRPGGSGGCRAASQWRPGIRTETSAACTDQADPCLAIHNMTTGELIVIPCREHAFDVAEWESRLPQ